MLPKSLDERQQLARGARREEVPAQPAVALRYPAAGIAAHGLRPVRAGSNDSVMKLTLPRRRGVSAMAPSARRILVGERAAVGVGAGGVNEAKQGDAVMGVAGKPRGFAVDIEHAPLGAGMIRYKRVAARRRRYEFQRRQQLDVVRQRRDANQRGEQRGALSTAGHGCALRLGPQLHVVRAAELLLGENRPRTCA